MNNLAIMTGAIKAIAATFYAIETYDTQMYLPFLFLGGISQTGVWTAYFTIMIEGVLIHNVLGSINLASDAFKAQVGVVINRIILYH